MTSYQQSISITQILFTACICQVCKLMPPLLVFLLLHQGLSYVFMFILLSPRLAYQLLNIIIDTEHMFTYATFPRSYYKKQWLQFQVSLGSGSLLQPSGVVQQHAAREDPLDDRPVHGRDARGEGVLDSVLQKETLHCQNIDKNSISTQSTDWYKRERKKHTTVGIRWWSPTQLLTYRRVA
ncbi:hypothetical protein ASPZODRAFT_465124 [Penicilliopsis zonata CBS 506.65]|uniref:Uncharacterized protein n=1 Tax=Penicilliopsis zonata CBS 506.65 TaxID=1073090 RepID=A0A1L9SX74_9EURO|nr:hypothetical protein ASPZODRAFT_465124 [Penicilliopsis zonata CBS 506.65]OJJ51770.1 hypothetical protein ASPZODRAFT_465124 [Penicilliopsis zonata CBS 506.65]